MIEYSQMFGYIIFLTIIWFILGGRSLLAIWVGIFLAFAVATLIHIEVGKNPPVSQLLKSYLYYPPAIWQAILDTIHMLVKINWNEKYINQQTSPSDILAQIITITFAPRSIVTDHQTDDELTVHRLDSEDGDSK